MQGCKHIEDKAFCLAHILSSLSTFKHYLHPRSILPRSTRQIIACEYHHFRNSVTIKFLINYSNLYWKYCHSVIIIDPKFNIPTWYNCGTDAEILMQLLEELSEPVASVKEDGLWLLDRDPPLDKLWEFLDHKYHRFSWCKTLSRNQKFVLVPSLLHPCYAQEHSNRIEPLRFSILSCHSKRSWLNSDPIPIYFSINSHVLLSLLLFPSFDSLVYSVNTFKLELLLIP